MAWQAESRWLPFAVLFQLLPFLVLPLLAAIAAQGRHRAARRLALLAAAALAGFVALLRHLAGLLQPWEAGWNQGPFSSLASLFQPASFPLALFASFLLTLWPAARGRWREAAVVLVAGPGLGGLVAAAKLAHPRAGPVQHPFFGNAMGIPDDVATLALGLAILVPWLVWRLKPAATRIGWLLLVPAAFIAGLVPLIGGTAWAGDILAGWLLALFWVPFVLAVESLARDWSAGVGWPGAVARVADRAVDAVLARPTAWLLALVAVGVALRIASVWWTPLGIDAYAYAVMGKSFLATGSFTMPWGDLHSYLDLPVPSHHYPPLYPVLVAGFEALFGVSRTTLHFAGLATGLAAVLVAYLCSRNLYGHRKGLVVAAVVAVSPIFVQNTGQGYSENLVLILFTATLWAILKSLDRPAYIVLAGLLAGLGYLTKSSMGYFFIIAGVGGLAWRISWKGFKALRDPSYLAAIALFGTIVLAWAWRNWALFGNWETSHHLSAAYALALAHPVQWGLLILVTLVFYATLGYLVYLGLLPILPTLARTPKLGSEHDSGLWLALGLPLLLTAVIDAALWVAEGDFRLDNARYIGFVVIPAAWLLVRHADLAKRAVRTGAVVAFVLLLAGSLYFGKPSLSVTEQIGGDLADRLQPGDSVGFVDLDNHFVYKFGFDLTQGYTRDVELRITCANDPTCPSEAARPESLTTSWVLMKGDGGGRLPTGYRLVTDTHAASTLARPQDITLWKQS
ncbi:MAG: glycosyltransferase family 39 protein [Candidatus Thermoplasmatota archaeon]